MITTLSSRLPGASVLAVSVAAVLFPCSCKDLGEGAAPTPRQVITVALRNTDTYQYPTVGGDEEGALITRQARHYRVSEIRRDASTGFVCVYVYQPLAGYTGNDYAEIEIRAGSDGASPPGSITRVGFQFIITI